MCISHKVRKLSIPRHFMQTVWSDLKAVPNTMCDVIGSTYIMLHMNWYLAKWYQPCKDNIHCHLRRNSSASHVGQTSTDACNQDYKIDGYYNLGHKTAKVQTDTNTATRFNSKLRPKYFAALVPCGLKNSPMNCGLSKNSPKNIFRRKKVLKKLVQFYETNIFTASV